VTVGDPTPDVKAADGGDHFPASGTLTFASGETTKTITIEVEGDSKKEATEYFYLDLFGNSTNSLLLIRR
jgi:endoglucanase